MGRSRISSGHQELDNRCSACVNHFMKQSALGMWFLFLAGMVLGSGWVASLASFAFWATALVHLVEFFVKRSVLEKAGGSMGQHFVQTMIYGLFHWKPLEEQQAASTSEGP
jgi:hypothetical protein